MNEVDLAQRAELRKPFGLRVIRLRVQEGTLNVDKRMIVQGWNPQVIMDNGEAFLMWMIPEDFIATCNSEALPLNLPEYV